ncbi:MAG: hypothetical protein EZS28_046153, partial [Streblomastix strix]
MLPARDLGPQHHFDTSVALPLLYYIAPDTEQGIEYKNIRRIVTEQKPKFSFRNQDIPKQSPFASRSAPPQFTSPVVYRQMNNTIDQSTIIADVSVPNVLLRTAKEQQEDEDFAQVLVEVNNTLIGKKRKNCNKEIKMAHSGIRNHLFHIMQEVSLQTGRTGTIIKVLPIFNRIAMDSMALRQDKIPHSSKMCRININKQDGTTSNKTRGASGMVDTSRCLNLHFRSLII